MVKIIILIVVVFLSPLLGADKSSKENEEPKAPIHAFHHHAPLQEAMQDLQRLFETLVKVLKAQPTVEELQQKAASIFSSLEKELHLSFRKMYNDLRINELKSPETLFSRQQVINLVSGPSDPHHKGPVEHEFGSYNDNLAPLNDTFYKLRRIIEKWQIMIETASIYEGMIDQILKKQVEWENIVKLLCEEKKGLLHTDHPATKETIAKIYEELLFIDRAYSRNTVLPTEFKMKMEHLVKVGNIGELGEIFMEAQNFVRDFCEKRGGNLWHLLLTYTQGGGLAEHFSEIPLGFLTNDKNPIAVFLYSNDASSPSSTSSAAQARLTSDVSKLATFPPVQLTQKPLLSKRSALLQIIPSTGCDLLISLRAKASDINAQLRSIIKTKFVLAPISELRDFYAHYYQQLTKNLKDADNLLRPWAHFTIMGHPKMRVPQETMREIFGLDSNGPLCFGLSANPGQEHEYQKIIDGKLLFRVEKFSHMEVGMEYAQFILERLFKLPSTPIAFFPAGGISICKPKDTSQKTNIKSKRKKGSITSVALNDLNSVRDDYFKFHDHGEEMREEFAVVQENFTGRRFSDFLQDVRDGKESLNRLNRDSFQMFCLVWILTNTWIDPDDLGLIEDENAKTLSIIRIRPSPIFKPFFEKRPVYKKKDGGKIVCDDKKNRIVEKDQHALVGLIIPMILPLANEPITQRVKDNFTQVNHLTLWFDWIKALHEYQSYCEDTLLKAYPALLEKSEYMTQKHAQDVVTKLNALGLSVATRPGTVRELPKDWSRITNELNVGERIVTEQSTLTKIFKKIRPQISQAHDALLKKIQPTIDKEKVLIFFEKLVPSHLNSPFQSHMPLYDATDLNYTGADLAQFGVEAKKCFETLQVRKNVTLKDLIGKLNEKQQTFFQNKFELAEKSGIFHAYMIDEVQQALSSDTPVICEDFEGVKFNWKQIDQFNGYDYPVSITKVLESTRSLAEMTNALAMTDLSNSHPEVVIKVMDTLLPFLPDITEEFGATTPRQSDDVASPRNSSDSTSTSASPRASTPRKTPRSGESISYDSSWKNLGRTLTTTYYAPPPTIKGFFGDSLTEDSQQKVREQAQMECLKLYASKDNPKISTPSSDSFIDYWFREFVFKVLNQISSGDATHLQGILDLFILPGYTLDEKAPHDVVCLGISTHTESQEGPIYLDREKGTHHVLHRSNRSVLLFKSNPVLSPEMRLVLLKHLESWPAFLIKIFERTKAAYPKAHFHPWYLEMLLENISRLRELLNNQYEVTYHQIVELLSPELYADLQALFKENGGDSSIVLSKIAHEHIKATLKKAIIENQDLGGVIDSLLQKNKEITEGVLSQIIKAGEKANISRDRYKTVALKVIKENKGIALKQLSGSTSLEERVDFGWVPKGSKQNLFTIIREKDDQRIDHLTTPADSLDRVAQKVLIRLNPENYSPQFLKTVLGWASEEFEIQDMSQLYNKQWHSEHIEDLRALNPKLGVVALALGQFLGADIKISEDHKTLEIINLRKETELKSVCEALLWFPALVNLTFRNAAFSSIAPLLVSYTFPSNATFKPNLQDLPTLQTLSFDVCPIHDLEPLNKVTQIKTLNIKECYIGKASSGLDITMFNSFKPSKENKDQFKEFKSIVTNPKIKPLVQSPSFLIKEALSFITLLNSPDYKEPEMPHKILFYMAFIAENHWDQAFGPDEFSKAPFDQIWSLFQNIPPQKVAMKWLYARQFGLPPGTVRDKLVFEGDPQEPKSLTKLTIKGASNLNTQVSSSSNAQKSPITKEFVEGLNRFSNLTELSLISVGLTSFIDFPKMEKLTLFNGSKNKMTSLKGLSMSSVNTLFPELIILALHDNEIETDDHIPSLRLLKNLQVLDLGGNKLKGVPSLGAHLEAQLVSLELRDNNIQNPPLNVDTPTKKRFYSGSRPNKDKS